MKIIKILALLAAFSLTSISAMAHTPAAACYRDLCVGDHVSAVSKSGYNLYGTVVAVRANGTITVEWHFANGWPFTETADWPRDWLKKV